ncbi:hypothetical protein BpHYR1_035332 [Brachionus plicatilis]|uniref:Uncharacterized protein n=1 Tax=Brachionus plicatilis TaxID=10195 RepID=A0A3M7SAQ4_BRAPC|nr:hypothetical protein BpHYR1_035332 [Brachionus plicatilis]
MRGFGSDSFKINLANLTGNEKKRNINFYSNPPISKSNTIKFYPEQIFVLFNQLDPMNYRIKKIPSKFLNRDSLPQVANGRGLRIAFPRLQIGKMNNMNILWYSRHIVPIIF